MACTPTPTQTLFTTGTFSTNSVSTSIFNSVSTFTSTATIISTRCDVLNTTAGANPTCLSSTVISSTSLSEVVATNPITQLATIPVLVQQTNPIQTLFSPCPDDPSPSPSPTPTTSTTTTSDPPQSTIIRTEFSTYTDSNGVHTKSTTISSTSTGSLNGGGGQGNAGPNLGPIIGGVVGAVVGLLAICALVWYLLWRREQVKFLFDDDDDLHGAAGVAGAGAAGLATRGGHHHKHNGGYGAGGYGGRGPSRTVNLEDEIKGADAHPYQYGLVGGSPNGTLPSQQSQPSTMGYGHQRNSSRDALMTAHSPPVSPRHLDLPLPGQGGGAQPGRRASQYTGSSGLTDAIIMENQPPVGMANPTHNNPGYNNNNNVGRVSDDRGTPAWMGHHPRPSSSLLEAPISYPPGHGGFYQQYGPIDQVQPQNQQQPVQYQQTQGGGAHRLPLEPSLASNTRANPAHQALYAAAGLGSSSAANQAYPSQGPPNQDPYAMMTRPYSPPDQPYSPLGPSTTTASSTRNQMVASPPPGAAGARQYTISPSGAGVASGSSQTRQSDIFSAVMASGDAAAASATQTDRNTSSSPDFGFGRQRRSGEKSPEARVEGTRSPVIQHQDGGRAPTTAAGSGPNTVDGHGATDAPPPAYSDP